MTERISCLLLKVSLLVKWRNKWSVRYCGHPGRQRNMFLIDLVSVQPKRQYGDCSTRVTMSQLSCNMVLKECCWLQWLGKIVSVVITQWVWVNFWHSSTRGQADKSKCDFKSGWIVTTVRTLLVWDQGSHPILLHTKSSTINERRDANTLNLNVLGCLAPPPPNPHQ